MQKALFWGFAAALVALWLGTGIGAQSSETPYLTHFVAPIYLPLARQAYIQGEVHATAELDSECKVASINFQEYVPIGDLTNSRNGQLLLRPVAGDAIKKWQFASCKMGAIIPVTVKFVLAGKETTSWMPTQIVVSSNPLVVEVSTN